MGLHSTHHQQIVKPLLKIHPIRPLMGRLAEYFQPGGVLQPHPHKGGKERR